MDDIGARLRRHYDQAVPPTTADDAIGRSRNAEPQHQTPRVLAAAAAVAVVLVAGTWLYAAGDSSAPIEVSSDGTPTTATPTTGPPSVSPSRFPTLVTWYPTLITSESGQPSLTLIELGGGPRGQVAVDDPHLAGFSGATAAPDGRLAIWAGRRVWWRSSSGEQAVTIETGPNAPDSGPTVRAVFSHDPEGLWVVQPGFDFSEPVSSTLAWWVDTTTGDVESVSTDLPSRLFPIGTLATGDVVLGRPGGYPWPHSDFVVLTPEGAATSYAGHPLAVVGGSIVVQRCDEAVCRLLVVDPSAQTETTLTEADDGGFVDLGGPLVPGDWVPVPTASPTGRQVLVGRRTDDSHVTSVVLVDLDTASAVELGTLGTTGVVLAFFSCDGRAIAAVEKGGEQEVVATLDGTSVAEVTPTPFGVPEDRWVVGLGSCVDWTD